MPSLIGVDVGGTFTDVVEWQDGALSGRKVPTTPQQWEGVAAAVAGTPDDIFLHGTTAATNALLEGKGARLALVTGSGYEDLIEIGRQDRPSLYDNAVDRPSPLVDRSSRIGFTSDLDGLLATIRDLDPEAVVIGLLESHLDPAQEREVGHYLRQALTIPVLESSQVSPEFREYERLATTLLSAYLTPSVANYLRGLDQALPMATRLVMTSSGGLIPFSQAPEVAGRLVLSGPAGGAVAAAALGAHHEASMVLSFDMGGTSTDVSRITGGELAAGSGHAVAGRVNRVPAVPIRTIGAGGGSIGWVDPGGALRVGPHSAGASPGPAAYGLGGKEPTVTDANLITGRIPQGLALAGSVVLRPDLSRQALDRIGEAIAMSAEAVAEGMLEVVNTHMEHALRSVSVEEGADPRQGTLVAFGGAGGLHAVRLARRLGMQRVLIPPLSGVFSALGLLLATPRTDAARTVMLADGDPAVKGQADDLAAESVTTFTSYFGADPTATRLSADMRYRGQSHELEIEAEPRWDVLRARFEEAHRQRFGFDRPGEPVELVNLRASSSGPAPMRWDDLPPHRAQGIPEAREGVWRRESLPAGFTLEGPAIVAETNSVVLLDHGDQLVVLYDGTLEVNL